MLLASILSVASSSCYAPRIEDESAVATAAVTAQPHPSCVHASYADHDYWFCDADLDWAAAQANCAAVGMHLVRIDDGTENDFVDAHIDDESWIGATDQVAAGEWVWNEGGSLFWSGGRAGSPVAGAYANWDSFEPDDSQSENCARIDSSDGQWDDRPCSVGAAHVCESSDATTAFPQAPDTSCARVERGGHEYWFCNNRRPFAEARDQCRAVGSDLVVVDDAQENAFVRSNVRDDSFIGLTDHHTEGVFKWLPTNKLSWCGTSGGRSPGSAAYANWDYGEPAVSAHCEYKTRNGRGYWFCDDSRSWADAQTACASVGMNLARIDDSGENTFVRSHIFATSWIGGSDLAQEGLWRWVDGNETFWTGGAHGGPVPGRYTNWDPGDPDNSTLESCLTMRLLGGRWEDTLCAGLRPYVCEDAASDTPQLPDVLDCAILGDVDGEWDVVRCDVSAAYACETVPPDADAELHDQALVRDDYRQSNPTVRHLQYPGSGSTQDPFLTRSTRMGLRECVDTVEALGEPEFIPHLGLDAVRYEQRYLGVPVYTGGYVVHRQPVTGAIRMVHGRVEHGISISTVPQVSQSTARSTAAVGIGRRASDYSPTPVGELKVVPTKQGANPGYELAWIFSLPPRLGTDGHTIAVSARTGAMLFKTGWKAYQCASTDIRTGTRSPAVVDVSAFQQTRWGDSSTALAQQVTGVSAPNPYVLTTTGIDPIPGNPLSSKPLIVAQCPGQLAPFVAGLPMASVSVDESSPDNYYAAALYMATQRCVQYVASTVESQPGIPWIGFDGTGDATIDLRLFNNAQNPNEGPHYFNGAINFPPSGTFYGASVETVCHEFAHGITSRWLGGRAEQVPETAAIDEGLADILGTASEMSVRGFPGPGGAICAAAADCETDQLCSPDGECRCDPSISSCSEAIPSGYCYAGDDELNQRCLRNVQRPELSDLADCQHTDIAGVQLNACPSDYDGPNYCRLMNVCYGAVDPTCCSPHRNSTVMSHWFYLVTNGDSAINSLECPFDVFPLDIDMEVATAKAMRILFAAGRDGLFDPSTGYRGFADATITAASILFGQDSPELNAVRQAWFAVNVTENFFEDMSALIFPRREAQQINPWATFLWPTIPGFAAWDIQLATGSFEDSREIVLDLRDVSELDASGNFIEFTRALPEGTTDRYFWRVRPHSDDDWTDCYPIHSFVGTGEVGDVENIRPDRRFPNQFVGDLLRPGTQGFMFDAVQGAKEYNIYVAKSDVECMAGSDTIEKTVPHSPRIGFVQEFSVEGLEPNTDYWLQIQPIGPLDLNGAPAVGECASLRFSTTSMRPPEITNPTNGEVCDYPSPHACSPDSFLEWRWTGYGGAEEYRLQFFVPDDDGDCAAAPFFEQTVDEPCRPVGGINDFCLERFGADLFPDPNPAGYCWRVVAVAGNDETEASPMSRFGYAIEQPEMLSPGSSLGWIEAGFESGALEDDTYGLEVLFSWEPVPHAYGYHLMVGRWPWRFDLPAPNPPTCPACTSGPESITFEGVSVGQSSTSILVENPGAVGEGRYCWRVTTILASPLAAGSPAEPQPIVGGFDTRCYTTGPALPEITIEDEAPGGIFPPGESVSGTMRFPYLPNGYWSYDFGDAEVSVIEPGDSCMVDVTNDPFAWDPTKSWLFSDLYDCEVRFTVQPTEGEEFVLEAHAFSDPDGEPLVGSATIGFDTCGAREEVCCTTGDPCDSDRDNCEGGTCEACGYRGGDCCDRGDECSSSDDYCAGGECQPCGGTNQVCCPTGDQCRGSSDVCNSDNTCETPRPCDEEIVHVGANEPQEIIVDLGGSQGFTRLQYNTFDVPDRIRIFHDGAEIADTRCVSTGSNALCIEGTMNGQPTGICAFPIEIDGVNPYVTVRVEPNCAMTPDTQWRFRLLCVD
jgi:hypothetical protein